MRKTYRAAMDQITVSEELRERILSAAVQRETSSWTAASWFKPVCSFAAFAAIIGAAGLWLNLHGLESANSTGSTGDAALYSTASVGSFLEASDTNDSAAPQQQERAEDAVPQLSLAQLEDTDAAGEADQETLPENNDAGDATVFTEGGSQLGNSVSAKGAASVVAYETLDEAEQALSFAPEVPSFVTEAGSYRVSVIDQTVLQIEWSDAEKSFVYRTAQGQENIDEDYSGYYIQEIVELSNADAVLCGDGETVSLILWQYEDQTFSFLAETGIEADQAQRLVEFCLAEASEDEPSTSLD